MGLGRFISTLRRLWPLSPGLAKEVGSFPEEKPISYKRRGFCRIHGRDLIESDTTPTMEETARRRG